MVSMIELSEQVLSVSELNNRIKSLLEGNFVRVRIRGEVSSITYHQASGHVYFTLKDKESVLKCALFKSKAQFVKFKIENGIEIECSGTITLYSARGECQLICEKVNASGEGDLALAFKQLKEKFEKKGYFREDIKKPLPAFPANIILITSKSGAVLQDMLRIAEKRWELAKFWLIDTQVQGVEAKDSVIAALQKADKLALPKSVIILARGGGSMEDLWTFNEEEVVEAIYALKTPLISAIGHEPDVVLSDYVASVRAPTPSRAIEIVLPDRNEWMLRLDSQAEYIKNSFLRILKQKETTLQMYQNAINQNSITNTIKLQEEKLKLLKVQLNTTIKQKLDHHTQSLDTSIDLLKSNFLRLLKQKETNLQMYQNAINQNSINDKIKLQKEKLNLLEVQLKSKIKEKLDYHTQRLESFETIFQSINPQKQHKKGWVQVTDTNFKAVSELSLLQKGSLVILQDYSATLKATIEEIIPNSIEN